MWSFQPYGKPFVNALQISYTSIANDLVRGYVYNTQTGVRRFRTYNVDGNYNVTASNNFSVQFGSPKRFTLSSTTNWNFYNYADMIGVDAETPAKTQVGNMTVGEDLDLSYTLGRQTLSAFGSVTHRHTTSERSDFQTINAQHYKYGVRGTFNLPAGFGISSDISFYKRVGYGVRELDTTDAVWNLRLTYVPRGDKHWLFAADGFDLLHKLSNVHYSVNATGRTVSYSNSLPRYFIVTVQYRLSIQPKR